MFPSYIEQLVYVACVHTTSNIGVSIISLHDTPRLHTLKRVIRNLIVWRTYK